MNLLPIVDRELRVAARRPATYRTRFWAALGAMFLATWKCFDFAWRGAGPGVQGRSLFYTLSGLAFVYCLFIGARVTADSVSEEKREGTLGLLFLTDLRGLDVVLGKLVASSLNSFYGLFAVLPLLALPLLLGGVTFEQFGHTVLVLTNTMLFSLSVGMFVSALSRNERQAVFATVLGVLSPALIPLTVVFFLAVIRETIQSSADFTHVLPWLMLNPFYSYVLSMPLPLGWLTVIPPESFWISLGAVQVISWLLLIMTAALLPWVWKDRARVGQGSQLARLLDAWRKWAWGNPAQRRALRKRLLERNPFLWLAGRDRLKPAYVWFFLFSMIAVWMWGYVDHQSVMFDFYPLVPTIFIVHTFLKVWVVTEVSHRLVEDQQHGALELLLSTPMTLEDIRRGQTLAVLRQFTWPVLTLCLLEVAVFQTAYPLRVILPVVCMLVADLVTLTGLAIQFSLQARSINQVLVKCIFYVLVLPWCLYFLLAPLWEWVGHRLLQWPWRFRFNQRVYCWFTIGILTDVVLLLCSARPWIFGNSTESRLGFDATAEAAVSKPGLGRLKPQT